MEPAIRLAPVLGDALGQAPITMSRYSKAGVVPGLCRLAERRGEFGQERVDPLGGSSPHGTGLGARLSWT